jgi:hypothetical protein
VEPLTTGSYYISDLFFYLLPSTPSSAFDLPPSPHPHLTLSLP